MENYRFVEYEQHDNAKVEFYVREIEGDNFLQLTFIHPDDKEWIESIQKDDFVAFFQNNDIVSSVKILTPYTENGFKIEKFPSISINSFYEFGFSRIPNKKREYYTKSEVDNLLLQKSDRTHVHA